MGHTAHLRNISLQYIYLILDHSYKYNARRLKLFLLFLGEVRLWINLNSHHPRMFCAKYIIYRYRYMWIFHIEIDIQKEHIIINKLSSITIDKIPINYSSISLQLKIVYKFFFILNFRSFSPYWGSILTLWPNIWTNLYLHVHYMAMLPY